MFLSLEKALELKQKTLDKFDLNSFVEELLNQISKAKNDVCTVKVRSVPAIHSDRLSYILTKAVENKDLEVVSYSKGIEFDKEDYLVHVIKCVPKFKREKRRGRASKVSDLADKILKFHLTQLEKEIKAGENCYMDAYKIELHYDAQKVKSALLRRLKKLGYSKYYLHVYKDSGIHSREGADAYYQDCGGKIGHILNFEVGI